MFWKYSFHKFYIALLPSTLKKGVNTRMNTTLLYNLFPCCQVHAGNVKFVMAKSISSLQCQVHDGNIKFIVLPFGMLQDVSSIFHATKAQLLDCCEDLKKEILES